MLVGTFAKRGFHLQLFQKKLNSFNLFKVGKQLQATPKLLSLFLVHILSRSAAVKLWTGFLSKGVKSCWGRLFFPPPPSLSPPRFLLWHGVSTARHGSAPRRCNLQPSCVRTAVEPCQAADPWRADKIGVTTHRYRLSFGRGRGRMMKSLRGHVAYIWLTSDQEWKEAESAVDLSSEKFALKKSRVQFLQKNITMATTQGSDQRICL